MSLPTSAGATASPGLLRNLVLFGERFRGRLKPSCTTQIERYGIRRDLSIHHELLYSKVPIALRRMNASDVGVLFPDDVTRFSKADQLEIAWRKMFVAKAGIANGIVAMDEIAGEPCAVLWRFGHADNALVRHLGGFPELRCDEVLIENAYAPRAYRGMGVMPVATELLAREAAAGGLRYMYAFVGTGNRASLKSARRIGFDPYLLHTRRFRLFGLLVDDRFDVFPDEDPRRRWEL